MHQEFVVPSHTLAVNMVRGLAANMVEDFMRALEKEVDEEVITSITHRLASVWDDAAFAELEEMGSVVSTGLAKEGGIDIGRVVEHEYRRRFYYAAENKLADWHDELCKKAEAAPAPADAAA